MRRLAACLLVLTLLLGACSDEERVVVAAGTTLVDSGFLETVFEAYPEDVTISVVGVSSLEALGLAGSGSADLAITHLPDAEAKFLLDHPGAEQSPVFTSYFVLVGPPGHPADDDVVDTMRMIAAAGLAFVSRADGSGTAAKEAELWALAGIDPTGQPWYAETGQGMGFTLQVADQRGAFTLAEAGTFMDAGLVGLTPYGGEGDDERIANPYAATLAAGAGDASDALYRWLLGPDALAAMVAANLELFGEPLYIPTSPEVRS